MPKWTTYPLFLRLHRWIDKRRNLISKSFTGNVPLAVTGTCLSTGSVAMAEHSYPFVYVWFAITAIWTLGGWYNSGFLADRRRRIKLRKNTYSKSKYRGWLFGVAAPLIFFFGNVTIWVRAKNLQFSLDSKVGFLYPANKPTPPNGCTPTPNGLVVLMGGQASQTASFPARIFEVEGETLLSMDRNVDGSIAVTTDIYDRDHNIAAEINENHYDVDSQVYRIHRDDESNLEVWLRKDKEHVLSIHYLNRKTISITGVFRTRKSEVRVTENSLIINGRTRMEISDSCDTISKGGVGISVD